LCAQGTAAAIVTGESVGQVSSQTLPNLAVISEATVLPILRPLVAANKEEIFEWARKIGSFELSAKVPEYCALVNEQPATKASRKRIAEAEETLDLDALAHLVDERTILGLRTLDLERLAAAQERGETEAPATLPDGRDLPVLTRVFPVADLRGDAWLVVAVEASSPARNAGTGSS